MKRSVKEMQMQYQIAMDDEGILLAAEKILLARLTRQGQITDPMDCTRFLKAHCAHLEHEVFGCIFLDTRHRIIQVEQLFRGTVDGAEIHPREVAKAALAHNAAAVVLYHNHPSGDSEPSAADRAVTARLKQVLALIEVRLIDHIVVAAGECTSLAARGWV